MHLVGFITKKATVYFRCGRMHDETFQKKRIIGFIPFVRLFVRMYEGWNFNSGNYLFTTDTK